jgi:sensor domain CHASE-containing protein
MVLDNRNEAIKSIAMSVLIGLSVSTIGSLLIFKNMQIAAEASFNQIVIDGDLKNTQQELGASLEKEIKKSQTIGFLSGMTVCTLVFLSFKIKK